MTGYGKAEAILETGKITVEVRSLNGKTADISLKTSMLPKDKEMTVRQKIAAELTRGNIDFFMTFEPNAADSATAGAASPHITKITFRISAPPPRTSSNGPCRVRW